MDFLKLEQDNANLRLHQKDAKQKIFKGWNECNSILLQMPTGTGKTYLFTSIINDLISNYKNHNKEINILVVAHRMELLDQISETLSKFGIVHGFIQGAREQHLWKRVQVASILSILTEKNYLNTMRQRYDYIIVDEAHHSLADSYVKLFELFPDAKKLGVTATPWRFNQETFTHLYDRLVVSPQISWFIAQGLLADFDYISIKPDSEIQRIVNYTEIAQTGDFVNAELDNAFNNMRIRSKLFESYRRYANGRKGIIYAINRTHAARIAELYSSKGVKAVAIDCETPKDVRTDLINRFKNGDIKVLVNVDIFTEGFDCPDVSFIQLARPTRSLALYLQQVGRGLRIHKEKENTIILDNVGLYNYFGLPDANRKWHHHFRGLDTVENQHKQESKSREIIDVEFDESKLEEEDEPMILVKSSTDAVIYSESETHRNEEIQSSPKSKLDKIEEFEIAGYYLIRGTEEDFKVYPLIMKRGHNTGAVSSAIYHYNNEKPITFTDNFRANQETVANETKLQAILDFAAMRLGLTHGDIYHVSKLFTITNMNQKDSYSLFEVFKALNQMRSPN